MARRIRRLVAVALLSVSSLGMVVAHQSPQAHAMAGTGCAWLPWTPALEKLYYWSIVDETYLNGVPYMIEVCVPF